MAKMQNDCPRPLAEQQDEQYLKVDPNPVQAGEPSAGVYFFQADVDTTLLRGDAALSATR